MKPQTATTQEQSPATPGPALEALPTPTQLEVLTSQKAELETAVTDLTAKLDTANRELDRTRAERDGLVTRLDAIESNSFVMALNTFDAGAVLTDAGERLATVAELVSTRQEKGSVTLEIKVEPFKNAMLFKARLTSKEPKTTDPDAVFYVHEGKLTRNDPRQREFGFPRAN